jgi:3-hydroxyacyl-CoA dehydrogenase
MFHADQIGLRKVHDALSRYAEAQGALMAPAPLLARLAKQGKGFGDM